MDQNERHNQRFRIEIKVSQEEKALIIKGASIANQGISEFVRGAAVRAAHELLSNEQ